MQEHNHPVNAVPCMIIALSLIAGVAVFGTIATLLEFPGAGQGDGTISVLMAGVGVTAFLLFLGIPPLVASGQIKQWKQEGKPIDEVRLAQVFQLKLILGLALLEGGAFANLVAYMIERNHWSLYIVGGLLMTMVAQFPTPSRIEDWVRHRMELLELEM